MNSFKRIVGYFYFIFFAIPAYSQKKLVELPGTQVLGFQSKIDSQQYVLYVNLPGDYAKTDKKYPVLFVTDAQWLFAAMYVGYGSQHYDGLVPDLIIVGITWTDDYENRRARDFTPTRITESANTGNAPKFLSVIKNEIINLIDSSYRTKKNDRGLFGTSLGGFLQYIPCFMNLRSLIVTSS